MINIISKHISASEAKSSIGMYYSKGDNIEVHFYENFALVLFALPVDFG